MLHLVNAIMRKPRICFQKTAFSSSFPMRLAKNAGNTLQNDKAQTVFE